MMWKRMACVQQPVTVTRMKSFETIEQRIHEVLEQRIHEVLEQKRELFDNQFAETETPQNLGLSQKEIFGLFGLNAPKYQASVA